jgi:hypothetical protein
VHLQSLATLHRKLSTESYFRCVIRNPHSEAGQQHENAVRQPGGHLCKSNDQQSGLQGSVGMSVENSQQKFWTGVLSMNVIPLPRSGADLLAEYKQVLASKNPATADAYMRALRQLITWLGERPRAGGRFVPEQFTRTAMETYLAELDRAGYSVSHRARMKAAASGFARWLIEDKELMRRNPARGVEVPAQASLAPRQLTPDQRSLPCVISLEST